MNSRLKVVHEQVLDIQNVMANRIGKVYGLERQEVDALARQLDEIQAELNIKLNDEVLLRREQMAWMKLGIQDEKRLDLIEAYAGDIRKNYEEFLVIGIGGSSLGAKALLHALNHMGRPQGTPRIFFLENADPETLASFENSLKKRYGKISYEKVAVNVISKSGTTAETAANFELVLELMKEGGLNEGDISRRVIATTDLEKGALRKIATEKGFRTLIVPDGVGGRFSVFSDVGLFPLAVGGVDIRQLLSGVRKGFERSRLNPQDLSNHAFQIGSLLYLLDAANGAHLHGLFLFGEAFEGVAAWFEQLWAESLGKNGGGPRPLGMIGARALHGVHQDNVGGKRNKAFLLVGVEKPRIQPSSGLLSAMMRCTTENLTQCQRPNMTLMIPSMDETSLGELLFTLEMATHVAGRLYQVNPYDQPAVEEAKVGAREALQAFQKMPMASRSPKSISQPTLASENIEAGKIGNEHGLTESDLDSIKGRLEDIQKELLQVLEGRLESAQMGWLKLAGSDQALEIRNIAAEKVRGKALMVVVGMGGSVSGTKAVSYALSYPGEKRSGPEIFFLENVDSESFLRLEGIVKDLSGGRLDYSRTLIHVVSQSGETVETLANLKVLWERILGSGISERDLIANTVATTNSKDGALLEWVNSKGCRRLSMSKNVMGLFSIFGNAGLFSLTACGWDIEKFLLGMKKGLDRACRPYGDEENHAFRLAEAFYLLDTVKGKDLHGFFMYGDAFRYMAEWLEQLWIETLAKSESVGPRPLAMIGTTAQHSVNQDNIAGRNDKAILFVGAQTLRADYRMSGASVDYLKGNRMSELLHACMGGTSQALTARKRPNMTLMIPVVNEESLGEFLFTMALTVHVAGCLYGVDTYHQPAIDRFKSMLREISCTR